MNSYHFSEIKSQQRTEEFIRLKAQAEMFWDKEREWLKKAGFTGNEKVVDLGCGAGFTSRLIVEQFPETRVVGIDKDPGLLQQAKLFHDSIERLSFKQGSAYDIDVADQSVDFIYSRLLYQHLDKPECALAEAFRICAPSALSIYNLRI